MKTLAQLLEERDALRLQYTQTDDVNSRKVLEMRGKLTNWAIEKIERSGYQDLRDNIIENIF